ncbi:formate dehydrogenase subunit gamma [Paracoccus denitrificans]|jgi:formate dehydrogenase subunit gamma|uniref:Formate dehydrogenase (Quinone-dependent) cytochrome b subunit n=1 Tax=Paracoccus denitrificans (strain Pd 1222) TaxID=318586 RepID=A1B5W7_PARDP|nr:formate dehydrogenase subunit gamma [Paracoccus denitrificans]ABL70911.1 formate dehydrogenase (quinone-dependent) cytochrome b subunit [Paracoccus denitrificans PD1222]MBB4627711.1 formate dehydrogenase subunit gamma [Paracoccus denitrificans]MCU7428938.1 formate dehydrogenase subunit gamma [Paracoccus denitrificans]QAR26226.1 formate dehydrogenase subunit gamma [Paracoccus denitrificans]UPV95144.1 formate dehydrogenase subunit gamma [Paracoccus denitrificans]
MPKRMFSQPGDHIESRHPVTVSRYRGITRLNHWVTAASLIVLLLSGLALFHPSLYFLTGLFGGGQTTRWLHPFVGVLLFFSFLLLFLQMWRLNLPRPEDRTWVSHIGEVVRGEEEKLPELGKYNAGQKFVFWAMSVLIAVLIVSGVMIWQQYFPDLVSIPVRRWAVLIHALAAVAIILTFILHVYAAIWTRGTIRAMTRGTVTGGWAWRHHRKWLRELAGREGGGPAE